MTISLIDSASAMARVLDATPHKRADLVREMWAPMAGMYHFIPAQLDMASIHRQNFGFDWEESSDQLREGLQMLVDAAAWTRVAEALEAGAAALKAADPSVLVPDLTVLLLLGDPTSEHFLNEVQGLSGFGGISGYIVITVWPTQRVLDRLEAIAVHELHHNIRYSPGGIAWNPATVTVGEHVISEGLADTFAMELYGGAGHTHFVTDATRSDDQVLAKVATGLEVTGMQDFAGWVLGDATARLMGGSPVGLPTGAGYAAGARLVAAYVEATGTTAAQNVRTPAAEILLRVLPCLGLEGSERS
ncbi:DUF2268 domain-containing protein [Pseudoclavibacter sp. VKM Ac-2867]|uniref:DUF2268 domain-containing protein n=1 Tax=Pseudoclavibacter sp. VKM Ac-2867 TaxID=2783829 RepID=UPI00188DB6DD|nr:DUF2268 domain-containing putative Zn-dependent protease [Pseudoclavibacter sp. VKM Ac-2867]MBF4459300.1 peptidase [Pseudoclavibacter sp. VKM Ac-2867]